MLIRHAYLNSNSNREDDGYGDDIEWATEKNGFGIDTALELPETAGADNFGLTPIANYATSWRIRGGYDHHGLHLGRRR